MVPMTCIEAGWFAWTQAEKPAEMTIMAQRAGRARREPRPLPARDERRSARFC